MYECQTCGQTVTGLNAARKHAKQGHKTQREAFQAGQLHTLILTGTDWQTEGVIRDVNEHRWQMDN